MVFLDYEVLVQTMAVAAPFLWEAAVPEDIPGNYHHIDTAVVRSNFLDMLCVELSSLPPRPRSPHQPGHLPGPTAADCSTDSVDNVDIAAVHPTPRTGSVLLGPTHDHSHEIVSILDRSLLDSTHGQSHQYYHTVCSCTVVLALCCTDLQSMWMLVVPVALAQAGPSVVVMNAIVNVASLMLDYPSTTGL